MARSKQSKATLGIIADTSEKEAEKVSAASGDEVVYVACGMPLGIKFDDVDNGNGGTKVVKFPGVNHTLRGAKKGVLLGAGNAVLVSLSRKDWEDIKRKHGKERAFTALPPLLWEMKNEKDFKARRDEIADMKTGVEPIDPASVGVEEVKRSEV